MLGAPLLLFGISRIGFAATTATAACLAVALLLPLAGLVLRRRPQDMGLQPDGLPLGGAKGSIGAPRWTRRSALRTAALRTVLFTFGLGMMIQIGFLTHQVTLLSEVLDTTAVSMTISATAIAALLGRIALARFADQIDARVAAAGALVLAASALAVMGLFRSPSVLIGASVIFGITVGNVTTLSPIIVRREFGASAFGAVFGITSCGIQLITALGPSFYGFLHDAYGDYGNALILAATLDLAAAAVVLSGRRTLVTPSG
jgi:MFS family permease